MLSLFFAVLVFGLFFGLLSLRMWLKKEPNFRGTCASQSPFLRKEGEVCGYCGKPASEGGACEQKK